VVTICVISVNRLSNDIYGYIKKKKSSVVVVVVLGRGEGGIF
jgi:hypothetical protein